MRAVSVVIPVYNTDRYVGEAIESVLNQTVAAAELIVVDDGSTDRSVEVVGTFGPRVHCELQEHSGIGAARNRGVALARSELLAFLDADDLWTPEKLERQLAAFDGDPALDAVFGHVQQFRTPELEQTPIGLEISPGPHVGAMLIRRASFLRVGMFSTAEHGGEFIDWYGRARDASLRMRTLPTVLMKRRQHAHNTVSRDQTRPNYARVLKDMLDRRRRQGGLPSEP